VLRDDVKQKTPQSENGAEGESQAIAPSTAHEEIMNCEVRAKKEIGSGQTLGEMCH